MKILLPVSLLLFLFYCTTEVKDEKQKNLIPSDKMALILVDMHLADATLNIVNLNQQVKNFKPEGYYNKILKKYGCARTDFEMSIDYYSRHPDKFDFIYEKVLNQLSVLEGDISQSKTNNPFNQEISKNTELHYVIDFELNTQTVFDHYLTQAITHSGNRAIFIGNNHAYGPALFHRILIPLKEIIITGEFYIHLEDTVGKNYPIPIIILGKDAKVFAERALPLKEQIKAKLKWNKITVNTMLEYPVDVKQCELKFYLNNPGRQKIFVDDMDIKINFIN